MKNCLLALRSLLEESGEARVKGLRDKEGRLGRIGKSFGSLRRVEFFSLAKEGFQGEGLKGGSISKMFCLGAGRGFVLDFV